MNWQCFLGWGLIVLIVILVEVGLYYFDYSETLFSLNDGSFRNLLLNNLAIFVVLLLVVVVYGVIYLIADLISYCPNC